MYIASMTALVVQCFHSTNVHFFHAEPTMTRAAAAKMRRAEQCLLALEPRRDDASLARALRNVQDHGWDYARASTQGGTHGIHPYPAKFIPQIPRQLIELLHPGDDSAIFDPFCGSGTTLVEAQARSLPAIGIDLNPLATLVARVKTRAPKKPIAPVAKRLSALAERRPAPIPPIPRVDHWFQAPVQRGLAALVAQIDGVDDVATREALQVALSSIIVRVSNQDGDTRYAAVAKPGLTEGLVHRLFLAAAHSIDAAHAEQFGVLPLHRPAGVQIITRDILAVKAADLAHRVGLVVTSPPYPNAYEYWLYHKYRMYWLGMDPLVVREAEIGARPHFFKKNPHTAADFERQMGGVFSLIAAVLIPQGLASFVVGRSIIHGVEVDNLALLVRSGVAHGFRLLTTATRAIPQHRKSFNPAHAPIVEETIAVFGR
jgi:hypothetical protein